MPIIYKEASLVNMVKTAGIIFLCLCLAAPVFGATILLPEEQPWRLMERANIAFERGEFGAAVRLAEEAKRNKNREYAWYASILSTEMNSSALQETGDQIDAALRAMEDRQARNAVEILAYFTSLNGQDYFHNSVAAIISHISTMFVLPEADTLIGDVYMIEGEAELAKSYYLKAWEHAYALDIPDSKYDILYKLARLAEMQDDDELFEQSLLLILAADPLYSQGGGQISSYLRSIIQSINRGYSADRIFLMYRASTYRSLDALIQLAPFYQRTGDNEKFLATSILAALTAFTRLYEIHLERDLDFTYTTLEDFFTRCGRHRDIQEWIANHKVWESFLTFADAVLTTGQKPLADELRRIVIRFAPLYIAEIARHAQ
jgi:tetratricopeptide (TPR) repeat protein